MYVTGISSYFTFTRLELKSPESPGQGISRILRVFGNSLAFMLLQRLTVLAEAFPLVYKYLSEAMQSVHPYFRAGALVWLQLEEHFSSGLYLCMKEPETDEQNAEHATVYMDKSVFFYFLLLKQARHMNSVNIIDLVILHVILLYMDHGERNVFVKNTDWTKRVKHYKRYYLYATKYHLSSFSLYSKKPNAHFL